PISRNAIKLHNALRIDVLWLLFQNLVHPVQTCESLSDLSTDTDHLKDWRNHETQVKCKREEITNRHASCQDHTATNDHDGDAYDSHQQSRSQTNDRCCKQGLPDIFKKAERSGFENSGLAVFSVKTFD